MLPEFSRRAKLDFLVPQWVNGASANLEFDAAAAISAGNRMTKKSDVLVPGRDNRRERSFAPAKTPFADLLPFAVARFG